MPNPKELTNEYIERQAEDIGLSVGYVKVGSFWYDLKFHIRRFLARRRRK